MTAARPAARRPVARPVPTSLIDILTWADVDYSGSHPAGKGVALMDRVAHIAAMRHSHVPFVTASSERIDFKTQPRAGQLVEVSARPLWAGRKSLTVEVELVAETIVSRERTVCANGLLNLVAAPNQATAADWCIADLPFGVDKGPVKGVTTMTDIVRADGRSGGATTSSGDVVAAMIKAATISSCRHFAAHTNVVSSRQIKLRHTIVADAIIDVIARVKRSSANSISVAVELWAEALFAEDRELIATGEFEMAPLDQAADTAAAPASRRTPQAHIDDMKASILPLARDRV